jgi:hypothetical protein
MIRRCLEEHITFYYGMIFDLASRTISDLRREIDFMVGSPAITLPSYISLAIPILGTPFFHESLNQKRILPDVKIRDLDSTTITMKPLDPMPDAVRFVKDLQGLIGFRRKVLYHSGRFLFKYRKDLSFWNMVLALHNGLLLCTPTLATARPDFGSISIQGLRKQPRTFIGTTEPLDPSYSPAFRIDSKYHHYFLPTMLTDHEGNLTYALHRDLGAPIDCRDLPSAGGAHHQAEAY